MRSHLQSKIKQQLLSTRDAAIWLDICQRTLFDLKEAGDIRYIQKRPGGPIKYDLADLQAYADKNKRGGGNG